MCAEVVELALTEEVRIHFRRELHQFLVDATGSRRAHDVVDLAVREERHTRQTRGGIVPRRPLVTTSGTGSPWDRSRSRSPRFCSPACRLIEEKGLIGARATSTIIKVAMHSERVRAPGAVSGTAETESPPVDCVITLVHGTWARGIVRTLLLRTSKEVQWTTENSRICNAVKKELGALNCKFRPFTWTGFNNHWARSRATQRLRRDLRKSLEAYPLAKHIVIAHSHGGNIALRAIEVAPEPESAGDLLRPDERSRIRGVACLSTPFLHITRLPADWGRLLVLFISAYFWVGQAVERSLGWERAPSFSDIAWGLWVGEPYPSSGFLTALVQIGAVALIGSLLYAGSRIADHVSHYSKSGQPVALLIVRAAGDEASVALGAANMFGWVTEQVVEVLVLALRLVPWAVTPIVVVSGGAIAIVGLSSLVGLELITAPLLITVVPFVVTLPLTFLSVLFMLPYGVEIGLASPFLRISAEPTPRGVFQIHQLGGPTGRSVGVGQHQTYNDKVAIKVVAKWVGGIAGLSPAEPAPMVRGVES